MTATDTDFLHSQPCNDTQHDHAVQDPFPPQAKCGTTPTDATPEGAPSTGSSHVPHDTQVRYAAAGSNSPTSHRERDTQGDNAGGGITRDGPATAKVATTPRAYTLLADPFLRLAADIVDDAENNRIANENRLRQLTRTEEDSDGEERGFGLDETHPDVARLAALVNMLGKVEHQATLNLNRKIRAHPLHPWLKQQTGVGDKQAARLLSIIGDPYWHTAADRPRTVSELWTYCGHGDATKRPHKGMSQADMFALGSPLAKMRVHLIAVSILKAGGPRARTYRARREATTDRVHATDCKRCGPSGHPALTGTPWSLGHQHADALRVTGKQFLRDLWREAGRLHNTQRKTV